MQKLHLLIKIILLFTIFFAGSIQGVSSEELNSVKDCIQHPEKCNEENIGNELENNEDNREKNSTVGLNFFDILKMIFATAFVIILLYILLKVINKRSKVFRSNQLIQNIGGVSLGVNKSVQIIKVGEKILVVGVGENIQLLKEIDDPEEKEQLITQYNEQMDQMIEPKDLVSKVMKRLQSTKEMGKQGDSSFSNQLKKQLDEMANKRKEVLKEMEKKEHNKNG